MRQSLSQSTVITLKMWYMNDEHEQSHDHNYSVQYSYPTLNGWVLTSNWVGNEYPSKPILNHVNVSGQFSVALQGNLFD